MLRVDNCHVFLPERLLNYLCFTVSFVSFPFVLFYVQGCVFVWVFSCLFGCLFFSLCGAFLFCIFLVNVGQKEEEIKYFLRVLQNIAVADLFSAWIFTRVSSYPVQIKCIEEIAEYIVWKCWQLIHGKSMVALMVFVCCIGQQLGGIHRAPR